MLELDLAAVEINYNEFALAADVTDYVDALLMDFNCSFRFGFAGWCFVARTVIFFVTVAFALHSCVVGEKAVMILVKITALPVRDSGNPFQGFLCF